MTYEGKIQMTLEQYRDGFLTLDEATSRILQYNQDYCNYQVRI